MMVFSEEFVYNKPPQPNKLYRRAIEFNESKQYWRLSDHWYLKKGRTEYIVWEVRFFDQNGVVYKSRGFCNKYYFQTNYCYVVFDDVSQIKLKRKVDYSSNVPFIMSERQNYWLKSAQAVLYVPIRYLDEMGYSFQESTTHDERHRYRYKKELVTPYFRLVAEEKEWTDVDKQKQALLNRLKKIKLNKEEIDREIRRAIRETTDLYIYS